MATKKRNIESRQIYHVINRGVENRTIFLNDKDYLRFIRDLYEFNDENKSYNVGYFFNKTSTESIDPRGQYRKTMVEILAFCLMPSHYHLLLKTLDRNGLYKFIHKLNTGYAKYFNQRHNHIGILFQGRYKLVPVVNESHFIHIPYYIHCNPLDLIASDWREGRIKNPKKAMEFLNNYRWSSHLDYCGISNFPSITERGILLKVFGGNKKYQKMIENWLQEMKAEKVNNLNLE